MSPKTPQQLLLFERSLSGLLLFNMFDLRSFSQEASSAAADLLINPRNARQLPHPFNQTRTPEAAF